jgi:alkanesulfonate monooxygenase SsuD/methylene tetrahydromethanopterin reductase-like flavin-dependent oxidoreductase (luciferase family)
MADYGHDVQFGYFLDPEGSNPAATLALARWLDETGYDLIGVQDHPYQPRHLDAMALMTAILAETERVRVFPDVANLALRPPAMLAKMAATLDQLSGRRFELGLGSGGFMKAVGAMGGPEWSPGEAVTATNEAIEIIKIFWSGPRAIRYEGEQYQIRGLQPGPLPVHKMEIWLGVLKPRMLRLTGRLADGWVVSLGYLPPAAAAEGNRVIDEEARAAGRDPSAIRRVYNIGGTITNGPSERFTERSQQIVGPVEHWVDMLTGLATGLGFSAFLIGGWSDEGMMRAFIEEVGPGVRERVAAAR